MSLSVNFPSGILSGSILCRTVRNNDPDDRYTCDDSCLNGSFSTLVISLVLWILGAFGWTNCRESSVGFVLPAGLMVPIAVPQRRRRRVFRWLRDTLLGDRCAGRWRGVDDYRNKLLIDDSWMLLVQCSLAAHSPWMNVIFFPRPVALLRSNLVSSSSKLLQKCTVYKHCVHIFFTHSVSSN